MCECFFMRDRGSKSKYIKGWPRSLGVKLKYAKNNPESLVQR